MRILPAPLESERLRAFLQRKTSSVEPRLERTSRTCSYNLKGRQLLYLMAFGGTGKTTFVKMWAGYLRNNGFPVFYFDAFASDYMDDAFLALAGEIAEVAKVQNGRSSREYKKYVQSAKEVGKVLLHSSVKVGVKALTLGALSSEDFTDIGDALISDVAEEASALANSYLETRLTKHAEERNVFREFRSALADLAKRATASSAAGDPPVPRNPVIFIIDELDRCRPPFALALLEKVKHFFNVEGYHFIIVTHLAQLEGTVRAIYGGIRLTRRDILRNFITLCLTCLRVERRTDQGRYERISSMCFPSTRR